MFPLFDPADHAALDLVPVDASVVLPGETHDPDAAFAAQRFPGAVRLSLAAASAVGASSPHMAPHPWDFARTLAALGVGEGRAPLFYDRRGSVGACRMWWLCALFGIEGARVLDGGLEAWAASGGPVETGDAASAQGVAAFRTRPRYALLAGVGDVLARGDAVVLDARVPGRFAGTTPEPRPGLRAGHIPGSVNLPYAACLSPDGRFLSAPALSERLAQAGLVPGGRGIASCGSGLTAATLVIAVTVAHGSPCALYDGSWAEWGADLSLPLETGA